MSFVHNNSRLLFICLFISSWATPGYASDPTSGADVKALQLQVELLSKKLMSQANELARIKSLLHAITQNESDFGVSGNSLSTTSSSQLSGTFQKQSVRVGSFPDDAIVTSGGFPGSITIPERSGSFRIGGFVRTDLIHDIESLGFEDVVANRTIPLDGTEFQESTQTRLSARLSRFNVDFRKNTRIGKFRTFIEADFFGGGDEFLSNYELRLRHAAAQLGNFYFGQWWSSYSDVASLPEGSDLGGPIGKSALRQPGIRFARNVGENWRYSFSVENPSGDLGDRGAIPLASDSFPDVIAYVQRAGDWGRIRLSGVTRKLESFSSTKSVGGASFSGRLRLPIFGLRDNLSFQLHSGTGITRYLAGFANSGLDGTVGRDGAIHPVRLNGGYIALQHWWSNELRSTLTAGALGLELPNKVSGTEFKEGSYLSGNLFWTPFEGMTLGIDAIYASREIANGQTGDGIRLQATARFDY